MVYVSAERFQEVVPFKSLHVLLSGCSQKGRKSHAFTPGSFSCVQPRDRYCPRGRRFWRSGSSGKYSVYFSGPCKKLPESSWAVESDCDLSRWFPESVKPEIHSRWDRD